MRMILENTIRPNNEALIGPAQIIAKLKLALGIPIGYQDETGFHIGHEPAETITNSHGFVDWSLNPPAAWEQTQRSR